MGAAVIAVVTVSSAICSLIYDAVLVPLDLVYLNTIVFILVIAALVQFVEMFMKKNMKGLYDALGVYLPLITTNCAVLGVSLNSVTYGYNFAETLVYGLGISIGFALALILMATIRESIIADNDSIPKSFQGSPIVLITASLMAIAFFGFQGMI
jgi:electron transport complex protein RnfA